jgi:hypothetical protein
LNKEHKLLNQICSSILGFNKRIKFVSVVTKNGRLLVGRSRSTNMEPTENNCSLNGRIFYFKYLIFALNSFKRRFGIVVNNKKGSLDTRNSNDIYFEITGSNSDGILAVTNLNRDQEKFLCIYFEPASQDKFRSVYIPGRINQLLAEIDYSLF